MHLPSSQWNHSSKPPREPAGAEAMSSPRSPGRRDDHRGLSHAHDTGGLLGGSRQDIQASHSTLLAYSDSQDLAIHASGWGNGTAPVNAQSSVSTTRLLGSAVIAATCSCAVLGQWMGPPQEPLGDRINIAFVKAAAVASDDLIGRNTSRDPDAGVIERCLAQRENYWITSAELLDDRYKLTIAPDIEPCVAGGGRLIGGGGVYQVSTSDYRLLRIELHDQEPINFDQRDAGITGGDADAGIPEPRPGVFFTVPGW